MDNYFTKKEQIVILVLGLAIISVLGFKIFSRQEEKFEIDKAENLDSIIDENLEEHHIAEEDISYEEDIIIMVHISGEVYNPGLIELENGDRLVDAVELAGGLKKNADLDKINLAKKLQDEDKIYIPKIGEETEIETFDLVAQNSDSEDRENKKININKCSKEELISLPGIGEATAAKILDYRKDNPFRKIEDIMEVSGIGEKKFSSIQNLIIVK